jgi:exodeoxyribonuclease-3
MRIATWNVNGLRARLDFARLWLAERQPDVVGLQELKMSGEQFPHDLFSELGYHAAVLGQKAWNGVAVLSREPLEVVQSGLPGQEELGARMLTASVAGLEFTTVYCPNGKHVEHEDYGRKLAWFDALAAHLEATGSGGRQAVVCGDFNVCRAPIDSWDEERLAGSIFHTDAERERMARLLDLGLHDLFRELQPEARVFSWWDYRGGAFRHGRGLRIDLVLGTRALLERASAAGVDRQWRKKHQGLTPSDHAPVVVEID